jgi:TonB-linked SusC/RagA family outer membrane protein
MKKNPDSYERKLHRILSKKIFRIMKITVVLMMMTVCQLWAVETYSQSAKISLKLENAKISDVLKAIEDQTEFYFLYSPKLIDVERAVDIKADNQTVDIVLAQILGSDISKVIYDHQIVLSPGDKPVPMAITQQKSITGVVYDSDRNSLPGVTVVIKGTTLGALTDSNGRFTLPSVTDKDILLFSFIGMKSKEVSVGDRSYLDVFMEEDVIQLDEVVAVGYMTQKKADLTGSVAVVTRKNIQENSYSNVLRTLQGQVPGLYIVADGDPTSTVDIQIRGLTSVNEASPLIVIDGVPTTTNLRNLNPKEIESIQILKDAASASIYGARAASGVILINTIQAKKGDMQVSYDAKFSVSSIINKPHLCNTEEYGAAYWQGYLNDGMDPSASSLLYDYEWHYDGDGNAVLDKVIPVEWLNAEGTPQLQKSADTDWWSEVMKPSITQDHQLSVLAGTENSKVLFSFNYLHDNGAMLYTYLKQYSGRLNTSFNLVDGRLTLGENVYVTYLQSRGDYYSPWNLMNTVLTIPSIVPVYAEDGSWGGTCRKLGMDEIGNPVYNLYRGKDNPTRTLLANGSMFADLKLLEGLHLKSQFGLDYTSGFNRYVNANYREAGGLVSITNNSVNVSTNYTASWIWTNTLNYDLSHGNHSLSFLAGTEFFHYYYEYFNGSREDIAMEDYDYAYPDVATGTQLVSGFGDEYAIASYFSRLNYSFMDKYLISLTGRFDGSSKFSENNKFGFFPAVSVGWRLGKEEFMTFAPMISDLKIRASWGVNGNSNISSNGAITTFKNDYLNTSYSIYGYETGNLPSGYLASHTGNPNLKWESTTQTNIGLDFGLYNNRLTGSVDIFKKVTTGMLWEQTANPLLGEGASMWINAADMTNTGFEAVITYKSAPDKDFIYSITGNISSYKNKIDNIPDGLELQYGGNGLDDNILGRPLRSLYGFVVEGIFQNQEEVDKAPEQNGKGVGRLKYKDLDGDGQITYEYDQTWIANYNPDFMYGINFVAQYKNFDFVMFWQGISGNDVFNDWKYWGDYLNSSIWPTRNHDIRILDAWSPTNTDSNIPALTMVNNNEENRNSTYYIENGSYLKMRNIELGYNLPMSICRKLSMKKLRIYFSAQNLITLYKSWGDDAFTGWDPEVSLHTVYYNDAYDFASQYSQNYTRPAIFTLGLNSTF